MGDSKLSIVQARPSAVSRSTEAPPERRGEPSLAEEDSGRGALGPIRITAHNLQCERALDPRLVVYTQPDSPRAAQFRVLSHRVQTDERSQVIMVTSANAGEGKTTCAVNLALALAECGQARVLLVEAVVRQPQFVRIFNFAPLWCFAEQIHAHRHAPQLAWEFIAVPELWIHVAAVRPQIGARRLVDALAFAGAIERMRVAGYDHIVIDTPWVLGSAEANLVQATADGVIVTCRGGRTTARELKMVIEQLGSDKILGTVLMEDTPISDHDGSRGRRRAWRWRSRRPRGSRGQ